MCAGRPLPCDADSVGRSRLRQAAPRFEASLELGSCNQDTELEQLGHAVADRRLGFGTGPATRASMRLVSCQIVPNLVRATSGRRLRARAALGILMLGSSLVGLSCAAQRAPSKLAVAGAGFPAAQSGAPASLRADAAAAAGESAAGRDALAADGGSAGSTGSAGSAGAGGAMASGASGSAVAAGEGGSSEALSCAGRPGHCVTVCQAGQCDCHCDCRSDLECGVSADQFICVAPDEPTPPCCGTGPQCGTSSAAAGCRSGLVCTGGSCGQCRPPCTTDSGCGDGYRCDASGLCLRKRCDRDGFVCPDKSACDATNPAADSHGCLHTGCSSDSECAPGVCLNKRCALAAGRCVPTRCG